MTLLLGLLLFAQNPVTVSGRVTADEVTRARVMRVALTGSNGEQPIVTLVDSDGTFEFSKVKPGAYTLIAFAATSMSAPMSLTVGTTDLTDLTVRLADPKAINGRITVQGNLPPNVPLPRVAFALAPLPGIPVSSATIPATAEPDGSFRAALPLGERQITLAAGSTPPGYKLVSLTYGTTDLLKNPLRVGAADTAELRVVFDASAIVLAKVTGRVDGLLTTQGVRVVLMHPTFGSTESALTADGSFVFPRVIPGNYVARLSLSGLTAGKQITVGDRDLNDVVITYPRQFVVTGHVIVEGGETPEVSLDITNAKTGASVAKTASLTTGVIMQTLNDGAYNVAVKSVPAGYRVKSIMYGTTDLQKAPLKIDGPVTWEIIVRLVKL